MKYTHKLTSEDQDFLNQDRTDPITGEKIEEGHSVVICAACKSAFFIESWEYLGDSHCDQTNTLEALPKAQNLYLQANIKYTRELLTFGFAKKPMFMEDQFGCALSMLFMLFLPFLSGIIGSIAHSFSVGMIVFLVSVLITVFAGMNFSLPYKTENKSIKQIENAKTKFSMYIDYKRRGLVIHHNSRKNSNTFIAFDDIKQFKYHIIYHPSRAIDSLFCQLQIGITVKNKTINYFATIHRDTIPEWSDFISKLPTDLRVLNTPFKQNTTMIQ
ncbi:hypothetical protein WAF17_11100 [Bernardetia sp. ABR2-2B]|uniref:hypothetical protein n=1 Tax=Bernardetia sp. ABR2-2B TaxID=3127472 RepID=UPI0030D0FFEC